jgi:hypothetical protein
MNQGPGDQGQRAISAASTLLMRSTGGNVLGIGLPILVALAFLPILVHGIGAERVGVLAFRRVLLGYFGLFGLNPERAARYCHARAFEPAEFG